MNIVGVYNLKKDRETSADSLASVLGATRYEALSRLRLPGEGPFTVAVLAAKDQAAQLFEKLNAAGFHAVIIGDEDIEAENKALPVRQFSFNDKDLMVGAGNERLSIPFNEIDLVLRGTRISGSTSLDTSTTKSFSMGMAVLSGGLMISKTTKTVREVSTEERERFVNLYSGTGPVIAFRENLLIYDSFGVALKPSRAENFGYLVSELRRLCTKAEYDERLLTRPSQIALLGPVLDPEKNLSAATALLSKVLRRKI